MEPRTLVELERGVDRIRKSPPDRGTVELIVRRPAVDAREALAEGRLDPVEGLVGDDWKALSGDRPDRDTQLTLMNARVIGLIAGERSRWPLAGDQLYVDLDLSGRNLAPGTRLAIGTALIEITAPPHTGCKKFLARFGVDALKFVNSPVGRDLNLRGIYARVVTAGVVRAGDLVEKRPQ